jgi:hypothetical protein
MTVGKYKIVLMTNVLETRFDKENEILPTYNNMLAIAVNY